jgi:MFS transporter, DHA2 family, multidrug resistance protein
MSLTTSPSGIFSISGRLWLILLMVQLSNMLFGMTITIANVVLPQIRGTMSASQDEISWAITLNLVATAVATPLTGWLAGRLGWRKLMFGTVLGFTISSLLCGLSWNLESLILFRVGQGIFGAPIMPLGQAILLATFPRHLHPTAIVIWGIGAVFGPVFGPILGSVMAEIYDWRAAFFIIVPPGIAALVCIWIALADHTERDRARFDWTGFLALSVAIIAVQLIFDRGHRLDWFDSLEITALAFVGVVSFWIFAVHCLSAKAPFVDPRLFLDRNFAVGTIVAFVMGMLTFTGLVLYPSLLHDLRGYPDSAIGVLLAARGVGNWIAFLIIVPLTRIAPRTCLASGLALQALAGFAMARFDINLTDFDIIWTNVLLGFGQSIAFTPMTVLSFATLPRERITQAAAIFTLMRNFGSSLFISMAVLVFLRSSTASYSTLSERVSIIESGGARGALPSAWSLENLAGLFRLSGEIERQAAMIGYINAFLLMALASAVAVPLAFFMRRPPVDP